MGICLLRKYTNPRILLSLAFLFLLLTIADIGRMSKCIIPQDEGILLVYADLIKNGLVPYKDFTALYTPGTFYLLSGAFYLFGENIIVERILGFIYQFLIVTGAFALGTRVAWVAGMLSAVSVIISLRLFQEVGAYSVLGSIAALIFSLLCANCSCHALDIEQQKRWAVLAGVLAGTTFLFRQDIGVVAILAATVALCPTSWARFKFFVFGLALPTSIMGWIIAQAGPRAVFESLVLDLIRNGPGRRLPINVDLNLSIFLACVVFNFLVAFLVRKSDKHHDFSLIWLSRSIALISVLILPSVLQRADAWHIFYASSLVWGLTVISLSILLHQINANVINSIDSRPRYLFLIILIIPFQFVFSEYRFNGWATKKIFSEQRWIYFDQESIYDIQYLINKVNDMASDGDKLFVGPNDLRFSNYNDTFLYFLFPKLRPASKYLEMNPGCQNRVDSGLSDDISQADFLILTSRYETWGEMNASNIPGSSEPNEVVRLNFCSQSKVGDWEIFRRCNL